MTTKHTPGPWFPVPYGDGQDTVICKDEAGNSRIAFMAVPGCRDQQERRKVWREIHANARLIAAAPELADVCRRAVDEAKLGNGVRAETLNTMLALLAKIDGEQA